MKICYLDVPYFVVKFEKHKLLKEELIYLISKVKDTALDGVSKTDWLYKKNQEPYKKLITPYFVQVMETVLPSKNLKLVDCWFQEYKKLSYHPWHNHGMCWALVYYLNLPIESKATVFKDFITDKEYNPVCKEGDFLIFPGWFIHKSPINKSINHKIIIACNFEENT